MVGVGPAVYMKPLRTIFEDFRKETAKRLGVELNDGHPRSCFLGGDAFHENNVARRCLLVGDAAGLLTR
ncbi:MAG: hypothetical protein KGY80_12445 [Candidatus Thorarchaeota archaeon]|nr:hypothetical protein [Candidatus Thorarchaeota archaeon]